MKKRYKNNLLMLVMALTLGVMPKANAQLSLNLAGPGNKVSTTYALNPAVGYTVEFDMYLNSLMNFNGGVTFTCGNLPFPVDMYINNTGSLSVLSGNCGSLSSPPSSSGIVSGVWYHMAYVYNPATSILTFYVNGSILSTASFVQTTSATGFIIGDRQDGVTNADSKFDNLKIWSGVRTASQIIQDQTSCFTGAEPGLDVLYHFEEGSGTTIFDAALGNGAQNGTITGTVSWAPGVNNSTSSTNTISACGSYVSPSGKYTWVTSGTYKDTIANAKGCDSIMTINLTIDNLPFTTTWNNGYSTGYSLFQGMFLNDNLGWSVYWAWDLAEARIAKTTDGGATYTFSTVPGSYTGGVAFVDANTGFACGNNGSGNVIAKSTDGGATWTPTTFPTGFINQLNTITFHDALHGTAAGYGGATYSTNDGGATWNYSLVDAGNVVFGDIEYIDNNTIWATGYLYPGVEGRAYLSTDGGVTWTLKHSSSTYVNFTGVKFIDPLNGYVCGGGALYKTIDGGNTWTLSFTGVSGDNFYDVGFGAGKFWLSGTNSSTPLLYNSTDGITWTPVSISPATSSALYHIMIPSANKIYLNGDRLIVGTNTKSFNASTVNATICQGDNTTLVAENATSFNWSNGDTNDTTTVSPTSNTMYYVTGSTGACNAIDSVLITVLMPSTGNDFHTACDSYTWVDGNTYTASTTTPTYLFTNAVGCDSVVTLNLTINGSTIGTDVQTACFSFTWIDGNTYSSSTNTPTYLLTNAKGCDSLVTLNLTINTVDVSVLTSMPTLTANATSATYQWVDCGSSFAAISGETNQNFIASSNGSYAVIVTQSGCTDTSACELVTNVGMSELNSIVFNVYPNPASQQLTISGVNEFAGINMVDVNGKTVYATSVNKNAITVDISSIANGVYMLNVYGDEKSILSQQRIVIQK